MLFPPFLQFFVFFVFSVVASLWVRTLRLFINVPYGLHGLQQ